MKNALSNLDKEAKLRETTLYQLINKMMQKDFNKERTTNWLKAT